MLQDKYFIMLGIYQKVRADMGNSGRAAEFYLPNQNNNLQLLIDKDLAAVLLSLAHQWKRFPE
jgi:hypothetical protein